MYIIIGEGEEVLTRVAGARRERNHLRAHLSRVSVHGRARACLPCFCVCGAWDRHCLLLTVLLQPGHGREPTLRQSETRAASSRGLEIRKDRAFRRVDCEPIYVSYLELNALILDERYTQWKERIRCDDMCDPLFDPSRRVSSERGDLFGLALFKFKFRFDSHAQYTEIRRNKIIEYEF